MQFPPTAAFLLVFCAHSVQAQSDLFDKAPPGVDEALRARVTRFYQDHVDGKFRAADALVAEDSKDAFFAMAKPRYESCSVTRLGFSADFTQATAVTTCRTEWAFHGRQMPVSVPITSYWKIVDGDWYWYRPATNEVETPFGKSVTSSAATAPASPIPANLTERAASILQQVTIEPAAIQFEAGKADRRTLSIVNGMPGAVRLELMSRTLPGLTAKLDKPQLVYGEKATLTLEYTPDEDDPPPAPIMLSVRVSPTGRILTSKVTFTERAAK